MYESFEMVVAGLRFVCLRKERDESSVMPKSLMLSARVTVEPGDTSKSTIVLH